MLMFRPVWFSQAVNPLGQLLILAGVVCLAWKNRARRSTASRLFVLAALLSIGELALRMLELSHVVRLAPGMIKVAGNPGDFQPNFSDPATIRFLLWQGSKCGLRISSWSLAAWAILIQPDKPPNPAPPLAAPE